MKTFEKVIFSNLDYNYIKVKSQEKYFLKTN